MLIVIKGVCGHVQPFDPRPFDYFCWGKMNHHINAVHFVTKRCLAVFSVQNLIVFN